MSSKPIFFIARYNGLDYLIDFGELQKMRHSVLKKSTLFFLAFVLAFGLLGTGFLGSKVAYADNTDLDKLLTETQERLVQTSADHDDAVSKAEALKTQIEENGTRITELEKLMPGQEKKSADALVALYKIQQEGYSLVNMLLNTESLSEFLSTIEYINTIHQINLNEVIRLRVMKEELDTKKKSLQESKMAIDAEVMRAEQSLKEAQEARENAQQLALEEAARQEAARQAELARKKAEIAAGNGGSTTVGGGQKLPTPTGIDWSMSKEDFVNHWAARIDAYMAGFPLAGQGRTFAEAAWKYGVDPRFSPAISRTESTSGKYCFKPHNAWGWGSVSWGSWEEAIDAHTRGLANGYGGTISIAGAKKYCPPTWEHWYYFTLGEMNRI